MNDAQALWRRQAESDFEVFALLRQAGVHECHLLHYLQMTTEKLGKAYFYRSGTAPPEKHAGFVRFLKALRDRGADLDQIAKLFEFQRRQDFENWLRNVEPLAYALQNIAPAEAGEGPNPEYPWPHETPKNCPIEYAFKLWIELDTGRGRKLLKFIRLAIGRFDQYA